MSAANFLEFRQDRQRSTGMTTEAAMLLMYTLGAYTAVGEPWISLVVGTVAALLLYLKPDLHGLVAKIGDKDMRAIMLFAAITFIVLPVLPDREMGPLNAWNPRLIWLVVVLVVGISLAGYIAYKLLGTRRGTLAAGILGGLISSTATTLSYARRAKEDRDAAGVAMLVICIATCVAYARVLTEIGVVGPGLLPVAGWPVGIMAATAAAGVLIAWFLTRRDGHELTPPQNPTQLKSALLFASGLALVMLAVEAARRWIGTGGVLAMGAIGGLMDLDAIVISNAKMAQAGQVGAHDAWRAIVIGIIANLGFKLGAAGVIGGRPLFKRVGLWFGLQAAVGVVLLLVWRR
jgi:uncharacterized membrane protein (DUF4010 family)